MDKKLVGVVGVISGLASFDGAQAATEVLQLLTHYAPVDRQETIKKFDGLEGTVHKWAVKRR